MIDARTNAMINVTTNGMIGAMTNVTINATTVEMTSGMIDVTINATTVEITSGMIDATTNAMIDVTTEKITKRSHSGKTTSLKAAYPQKVSLKSCLKA
jgi:hypothetical protein